MANEILDPNKAKEPAVPIKSSVMATEEEGRIGQYWKEAEVLADFLLPLDAIEPSLSEEPKVTCKICNGRGFIELDRIGLVSGPCPDCGFPK